MWSVKVFCLCSRRPVEPPAPAALAAAADVRVHEDHAAVEQARQRRVPLRLVDAPRRRRTRRAGRARCRRAACRGAARRSPGPASRPGPGTSASRTTYGAGSCPGASWRCRSVRAPVAQVDVRPDRRVHVGLVDDGDRGRRRSPALWPSSTVPAVERAGRRTKPVGVEGVERQHPQPVPAVGAEAEHDVAGERVDPLEPLGRVLGAHRLARRVWSWSRVAGDRAAGQPELRGAVVGDQQQRVAAVGQHRVLGVVLHARSATADRARRRRRVVRRRRTQTSLVSRLADQITTSPPLRVARTFELEPLVGLLEHQHVLGVDVPIACRHTWNGR